MDQSRIFINNFNYDSHRTYTWRKEWISEYESPWSILEKFRYLNAFSDKDIFNIFGTDKTKTKITKSQKDRDLVSMDALDRNTFLEVMGVDIINLNDRYKYKSLDVLLTKQKSYNHYFRSAVSLCPECIKHGFHSIWHQIAFIKKCPFHNIDLNLKCPICNHEIPYTIYNENLKKPFHCVCNNSLTGENIDFNYTKKWTGASNFNIVSDNLRHLLSLSEREVRFLKSCYFQDECVKKHEDRILDFILPLIDKPIKNKKHTHYLIKSTNNILFGNLNDYSNNDENFKNNITHDQLNRIIPKLCKGIYFSISRHILKKIIFKHRLCLGKLIFNGDFNEINFDNTCSYAYSYAMWKKSIEGQLYFSSVDNGRKRIRNMYEIDPLSNHLYYILFKDLKADIFNYINEERYSTYQWLLSRTLGHILYYWYCNWVYISNSLIQKGVKYYDFDLMKANIPFFLIKFPELSNDYLEFHYWVNTSFNLKIELSKMKCPFKGI